MYFKKGTWTKDTAVLACISAAHRRPHSLRQKGPGGLSEGAICDTSHIFIINETKVVFPCCLVLIVMLFEVVV